MKSLFLNIDCHSLPVADLDAAIEFYKSLGQELIWRTHTSAGLRLGDSELVLHTDSRPIETDLLVESVEDAIEVFTKAGGTVLQEPFDIQIGKCAIISDPWNNPIVILDQSKGLLKTDGDCRVI